MNTPSDFEQTLKQISAAGVFAEDADSIRQHLVSQLNQVAIAEGARATDLGFTDWASRLIKAFEAAVRQEICDPKRGALKEDYAKLLNTALSPEGVAATATVVLKIIAVVNPSFAVSSVAIYLATWLLKIGLNRWCANPAL
jgi:hypothetical protein